MKQLLDSILDAIFLPNPDENSNNWNESGLIPIPVRNQPNDQGINRFSK